MYEYKQRDVENKMIDLRNRDNWSTDDALEWKTLSTISEKFKSLDRLKQHPLRKIKVNDNNSVIVTKDVLGTPENDFIGNETNRRFRFTISTSDVDAMNDVVNQEGWVLDTFKRNPVVLWDHDATKLPIGRCVEIAVVNNKLKATVEFATAEQNPFAEHVFQLVKNGFLSATSVSFSATEMNETTDPDRGADSYDSGIDFIKQELLEFSIVNLPANPFCLIEPNQRQDSHSLNLSTASNNISETINKNERDLRKIMLDLHSRYNEGI